MSGQEEVGRCGKGLFVSKNVGVKGGGRIAAQNGSNGVAFIIRLPSAKSYK